MINKKTVIITLPLLLSALCLAIPASAAPAPGVRIALEPLDDDSVLLGYCAYKTLAHTRLVKIPLSWFYGAEK